MTPSVTAPDFSAFDRGPPVWQMSPRWVVGALVLASGVMVGTSRLEGPHLVPPQVAAPSRASSAPTSVASYSALLDATVPIGGAPLAIGDAAPRAARFTSDAPTEEIATLAPVPVADVAPEQVATVLPPEDVAPAPLAQITADVPLPLPRPPEFADPLPRNTFRPARQMARGEAARAIPTMPEDHRSFFEKIFGAPQPKGPMLAYAAPEDGLVPSTAPLTGRAPLPYDRFTAIYDISAHTVYMPDGSRLEAHSGLGDKLDDPRHVNVPNRGATPPHLYDLQPRAQLFHGVQALRLNPVGGGGIFGRNGLLAHTFMLGPNGQSNGCVSFRNYNAFLQAYTSGTVRRLAVVPRMI